MYTQHTTYILREADNAEIPLVDDNPDYQRFKEWKAAGGIPGTPAAPPFERRKSLLLAEVDRHLNAAANAKGYDSILSASLRAALPNSAFHAEGVAFGTWMDAVYAKCYLVLAQVEAGTLDEPTKDELIALLPVLQLPE
ncbi:MULTISPECIES: hypothetical protein [Variovorax]|uniref:hypothetical protein n=1 Tax=Variovorax TaxID=34072 RepID=UPI0021AC91FC|nr:hypothetical protein [Variovorax paradoxus]UVH54658.1 hypothetical protein NWF24_17580 [Variovorax paradoxus]